MIPLMHMVIASGFLGLGESESSFGTTLALLITFVLIMGGVVNFLIWYIVNVVLLERKQNQQRMREYDAQHNS
jgi:hypothetical protein